jgi:hypothetical protein
VRFVDSGLSPQALIWHETNALIPGPVAKAEDWPYAGAIQPDSWT